MRSSYVPTVRHSSDLVAATVNGGAMRLILLVVKLYAPAVSVVADVVLPAESVSVTLAPSTVTPPCVATEPVTSAFAVAAIPRAPSAVSPVTSAARRRSERRIMESLPPWANIAASLPCRHPLE